MFAPKLLEIFDNTAMNNLYTTILTLSGPGYFRLILTQGGGGKFDPPWFFAFGTFHGHENYIVVPQHSI